MARASFTGEYPLKIDGKGRLSIPVAFRRVLEQKDPDWREGDPAALVLLYGPHLTDRLQAYSIEAFDEIVESIESLEEGEEKDAATEIFVNKSQRLEIDKDGRIVMPQRPREARGLGSGDVMVAGSGKYFDIWPAEAYEAKTDRLHNWLAAQGEGFRPLTLLNPARRTGGD